MACWLVKTEPRTYSFDDLVRDGSTVWEGVSNNSALMHLRSMKRGDPVLVYHSGAEKVIVGLARTASSPYPDPKQTDGRFPVIDLEPVRKLKRSIPLSEIKSRKQFSTLDLVRISRLSVMPVSPAHWDALMKLSGPEA